MHQYCFTGIRGRKSLMNKYTVLLFHSIESRDLLSLKGLGNIRPEIFRDLLAAVQERFEVVSLRDVTASASENSKGQKPLLAITFDDGPKSYLTEALPVMESMRIPSACFLITDCIGDKSTYWRYLYNYCVNSGMGRELAGIINAAYQVLLTEHEIISFTRKNYDRAKNHRIVRNIFRSLVSEDEYRTSEQPLFLTDDDIRLLRQNPLVTFGIHTRTHPVMQGLTDEEIFEELSGSIAFYHKRIGAGLPMLSIPFGRLYTDYDERTIQIARRLSVEYIFSAYGGINEQDQPPFNVRRIPVNEELLSKGIDRFLSSLETMDIPAEYNEKEERLSSALASHEQSLR